MNESARKTQQKTWEAEHLNPQVLPQMDSEEPSSGVVLFFEWLKARRNRQGLNGLLGIEPCCGKGRNCIWLAQQGADMVLGLDFSHIAIGEARHRARKADVDQNTVFLVHDVAGPVMWPIHQLKFDLAIDCFGTTDVDSADGRQAVAFEFDRVLAPEAYLLVYALSPEDEFHREMIEKFPAEEPNSFRHPSGKFEKVFTRQELLDLYSSFHLIEERRVPKKAVFAGRAYQCNHHWMVFQKN